jgi:hypothetical protein
MKKLRFIAIALVSVLMLSSVALVSAATPPTSATSANTNSINEGIVSSGLGTVTPDFNYGPTGGPSAEQIISSGGVIQIGDVGAAVEEIQSDLNYISSHLELSNVYAGSVDGYFGSQT